MSSYNRRGPVEKMALTRLEIGTIRAALLRAADWSDVHEPSGYTAGWKRKERAFIERCRKLSKKLYPLSR